MEVCEVVSAEPIAEASVGVGGQAVPGVAVAVDACNPWGGIQSRPNRKQSLRTETANSST